jgi:AcrR family transcriptional regulator
MTTRRAASRARVLDATTSLLRAGGPNAVTVDAVTGAANVARATPYRHFATGNDLLAAAFGALMPPTPMPPERGFLRARLTVLVVTRAELMAAAPIQQWLGWRWVATPGSRADETAAPRSTPYGTRSHSISCAIRRDIRQSAGHRRAGQIDRTEAIALSLGPILLGKLSTLTDFDYRGCARAAVDGFLLTHAKNEAAVGFSR